MQGTWYTEVVYATICFVVAKGVCHRTQLSWYFPDNDNSCNLLGIRFHLNERGTLGHGAGTSLRSGRVVMEF